MRIFMLLFVLISLASSNCLATQETIIEVVQPNMTENGIVESAVTYLGMGNYMAGYLLNSTTAENLIKVGGEIQNRNVANAFGLQVKILGDPSLSDTIKAQLNIPKQVNVSLPFKEATLHQVVNATIRCLIKNAKYHNYLDLKIVGNDKFKKKEKIYITEKIKYSIQVKAFPVSEYKKSIDYFNSLKDLNQIIYLEFADVNKEQFIRVKIGYFHTLREAMLAAELIKKIKNIEYFIAFCDYRTLFINHKQNIKGLITSSGIWAIRETKNIELYDFTENEITEEIHSFSINKKNMMSIWHSRGYRITEISVEEKLRFFNNLKP